MHEVPEAIRRSLRILPVHRPDAASAVSDILSVLQREPSTRLSKCLTPHKIMILLIARVTKKGQSANTRSPLLVGWEMTKNSTSPPDLLII